MFSAQQIPYIYDSESNFFQFYSNLEKQNNLQILFNNIENQTFNQKLKQAIEFNYPILIMDTNLVIDSQLIGQLQRRQVNQSIIILKKDGRIKLEEWFQNFFRFVNYKMGNSFISQLVITEFLISDNKDFKDQIENVKSQGDHHRSLSFE